MGLSEKGYRDATLARGLLARIHEAMEGAPTVRLMEVCGTHTISIGRSGLRGAVPRNLALLSGPGCPVCVTPGNYIDAAAEIARGGATVFTFGDMVRVPGNRTSLEEARARGGRIEVAGSITVALDRAREQKGPVVFLAVGFETTAPSTAAAVLAAAREGLENFSVLVSHKLVPPALRLILSDPRCAVAGFLLPGHVSTVIGTRPYQFMADEFHVPGVVAGFELVDVLAGIEALVRQVRGGRAEIENGYARAVRPEGNPAAWRAVERVFEVAASAWRGIGVVASSGLAVRGEFAAFDAAWRYGVSLEGYEQPAGCECGKVLRGLIRPPQCPLFGQACRPESPVGPCMVSVEGACAVSHKYGER